MSGDPAFFYADEGVTPSITPTSSVSPFFLLCTADFASLSRPTESALTWWDATGIFRLIGSVLRERFLRDVLGTDSYF